ncbi:methyl-accepting chemotaxis protein, partial [Luteimonas sp. XNQY3]|nr:methyl-accepting chemotaxis protein [Luteimonas sp. XNQY3]
SVQRVTDIMAEISAASQEQAAGIEQVNQTITQMDETTQQNAALVEEASAAARAMEEQADGLASAISVFRLDTATALLQAVVEAARPPAGALPIRQTP